MSKRSRRRAREERHHLTPGDWRRLLKSIPEVVRRMMHVNTLALGRMSLLWIARHDEEWIDAVLDAHDRGDGLPLLVFADWLEERNRVDQAAQVRQIAARLVERAD